MLTLRDFPDCVNDDQIPSCEVDGKVHYSRTGHADVHIYTSTVSSHPIVTVGKETLHSAHRAPSGEVFLPPSDSLTQRLQNAWYDNGIYQVLEVLSFSNDHVFGQAVAKCLLSSVELMKKLVNNIGYNSEKVEDSYIKQERLGAIQLLSWHPHCTKLAVLSKDDTVTIFSMHSQVSPILKAKTQRNISCLSWRPLSSCELAIGCMEGVYLWHVDPNSVISRPSINCCVHLCAPNHTNITTADWNPQGNLLATGSSQDNCIWIWHVDTNSHVVLRRIGGQGTRLILWSPDGSKLLAATYNNLFRIWKCGREWTNETWRGLGCGIVAAAFCPASNHLIFATDSEPFLYCLQSSQETTVFQSKHDKAKAVTLADFTKVELDSGICVGGLVLDLAWDPKGKHLAVSFIDSPLIALFLTVFSPHFHLVPKFFINGTPDEVPSCITFENEFQDGANLTIAWSSGRVQYFPIIYRPEDSAHDIVGLNLTNGLGFNLTKSGIGPSAALSPPNNQTINTTFNRTVNYSLDHSSQAFVSFTSPKSP